MASPFILKNPAIPQGVNPMSGVTTKSPFFNAMSQSAKFNPMFGIGSTSAKSYVPPFGINQPGSTQQQQPGMTENDAATGLIQGSPDLSAILAQYGADSQADAASRDEAIRRVLVSYGVMPDISGLDATSQGFLNSAVNDQVRALMAKNEAEGTSVHARMTHENQLAQRGIAKQLAGRGALHSGETGFQLREQAQQAKNTQFDTLNELLGNIQNTGSSFAQSERERAMAIAQAQMQAAWEQSQRYQDSFLGADGGAGTSIPSVPGQIAGVSGPPRLGGILKNPAVKKTKRGVHVTYGRVAGKPAPYRGGGTF